MFCNYNALIEPTKRMKKKIGISLSLSVSLSCSFLFGFHFFFLCSKKNCLYQLRDEPCLMKVPQIRIELQQLGLDSTGAKKEIVARLTDARLHSVKQRSYLESALAEQRREIAKLREQRRNASERPSGSAEKKWTPAKPCDLVCTKLERLNCEVLRITDGLEENERHGVKKKTQHLFFRFSRPPSSSLPPANQSYPLFPFVFPLPPLTDL